MIIQTQDLCYSYGPIQVLKDLDLNVKQGSIFGFLGANGSGKTTTIKILLRIIHADKGKVFLFGQELSRFRRQVLARVGSSVEHPPIYANLSTFENLKLRALLLNVSRQRILDVLELVGLTAQANKQAKKLSLGMKQRLGIALALLADPELLILDEPTNGLDPSGIIDIRRLLLKLANEHGKTIFISSHLLGEIEKVATHIGILHQGSLVFQGSISELQETMKAFLRIEVNDLVGVKELLTSIGHNVTIDKNYLLVPFEDRSQIARVSKAIIIAGFDIYGIYETKNSLENFYLALTETDLPCKIL